MKVAIYVRVSTQEQAQEGYSIQEQTARLKKYCEARDWTVYEEYIDAGFSGAKIERPAIQKLIHDVKSKKVDLVLVYKLDRLSRSQKDTLYLIEDVFLPSKVDFASINENFDTSTPFGRAMIGILSVFAQLEREQIKERTSMGRVARAKDGYFHGGGFAPIGYDYIDGNLVINEYEAMQVRKVYQMFLDKKPINQIVKEMHSKYQHKHGDWKAASTVSSCLTNNIYIGKISWMGEIYDGNHEPIIDHETFYSVQKRYNEISWTKNSNEHKYRPFTAKHLLTGLLYCGNCGARYFGKGQYSGHAPNKKYAPYYTCYSRAKTAKNMIIDPSCKNKSYMVKKLDALIIEEIRKIALSDSAFTEVVTKSENISTHVDNSDILKNKVALIDKQLERLLDLYQTGVLPMQKLTDRLDSLNKEKQLLIDQLDYTEELSPPMSIEDAKEKLSAALGILELGTVEDKRNIIHELIERIDVVGEDLEIHWKFA